MSSRTKPTERELVLAKIRENRQQINAGAAAKAARADLFDKARSLGIDDDTIADAAGVVPATVRQTRSRRSR